MPAPKRVLVQPPSGGRVRRVLRDIGVVIGLAVQVVLALLGWAVVDEAEDHTPDVSMVVWCLTGTVYALVMVIALTIDSRDETGRRPTRLQTNAVLRWTSLVASLISGMVGLTASFMIVVGGPDEDTKLFYKVVGIWAVVVAWALIHWGFAQWYYANFYRDANPGFEFPGTELPDLVDFAYFSFTVGTTFATTDVMIVSRRTRWRVTLHSVISFFFNSAILVLALSSLSST